MKKIVKVNNYNKEFIYENLSKFITIGYLPYYNNHLEIAYLVGEKPISMRYFSEFIGEYYLQKFTNIFKSKKTKEKEKRRISEALLKHEIEKTKRENYPVIKLSDFLVEIPHSYKRTKISPAHIWIPKIIYTLVTMLLDIYEEQNLLVYKKELIKAVEDYIDVILNPEDIDLTDKENLASIISGHTLDLLKLLIGQFIFTSSFFEDKSINLAKVKREIRNKYNNDISLIINNYKQKLLRALTNENKNPNEETLMVDGDNIWNFYATNGAAVRSFLLNNIKDKNTVRKIRQHTFLTSTTLSKSCIYPYLLALLYIKTQNENILNEYLPICFKLKTKIKKQSFLTYLEKEIKEACKKYCPESIKENPELLFADITTSAMFDISNAVNRIKRFFRSKDSSKTTRRRRGTTSQERETENPSQYQLPQQPESSSDVTSAGVSQVNNPAPNYTPTDSDTATETDETANTQPTPQNNPRDRVQDTINSQGEGQSENQDEEQPVEIQPGENEKCKKFVIKTREDREDITYTVCGSKSYLQSIAKLNNALNKTITAIGKTNREITILTGNANFGYMASQQKNKLEIQDLLKIDTVRLTRDLNKSREKLEDMLNVTNEMKAKLDELNIKDADLRKFLDYLANLLNAKSKLEVVVSDVIENSQEFKTDILKKLQKQYREQLKQEKKIGESKEKYIAIADEYSNKLKQLETQKRNATSRRKKQEIENQIKNIEKNYIKKVGDDWKEVVKILRKREEIYKNIEKIIKDFSNELKDVLTVKLNFDNHSVKIFLDDVIKEVFKKEISPEEALLKTRDKLYVIIEQIIGGLYLLLGVSEIVYKTNENLIADLKLTSYTFAQAINTQQALQLFKDNNGQFEQVIEGLKETSKVFEGKFNIYNTDFSKVQVMEAKGIDAIKQFLKNIFKKIITPIKKVFNKIFKPLKKIEENTKEVEKLLKQHNSKFAEFVWGVEIAPQRYLLLSSKGITVMKSEDKKPNIFKESIADYDKIKWQPLTSFKYQHFLSLYIRKFIEYLAKFTYPITILYNTHHKQGIFDFEHLPLPDDLEIGLKEMVIDEKMLNELLKLSNKWKPMATTKEEEGGIGYSVILDERDELSVQKFIDFIKRHKNKIITSVAGADGLLEKLGFTPTYLYNKVSLNKPQYKQGG